MNTTQAQTPSGAFVPGRGGNQITPSFSPHPRAGVQLVVCGVGIYLVSSLPISAIGR